MTIRLLLADDHPIVLRGLRDLLAADPDMEVVGTYRTGVALLEAAAEVEADVLVTDYSMPGMTGLEVLQSLRDRGLDARVVLLAATLDRSQISRAVRLGVRALVLKDAGPEKLLECIRKVHGGQRWIDDDLLGATLDAVGEPDQGPAESLTPREREVLRGVVRGLSNRRIARSLEITESTVKVHLHNIYKKVDVRNRVQLALYAHTTGLVNRD